MNLDLAKERGLLLPQQGPVGPAIIKDNDEDWSLVQAQASVGHLFTRESGMQMSKGPSLSAE